MSALSTATSAAWYVVQTKPREDRKRYENATG